MHDARIGNGVQVSDSHREDRLDAGEPRRVHVLTSSTGLTIPSASRSRRRARRRTTNSTSPGMCAGYARAEVPASADIRAGYKCHPRIMLASMALRQPFGNHGGDHRARESRGSRPRYQVTWFLRNVDQRGPSLGPRCRRIYFCTVRLATRMPRSSPAARATARRAMSARRARRGPSSRAARAPIERGRRSSARPR